MKYVLVSLLTLGSGALCLMFLTLLLAGSPNSSPAQLARIKGWMLAATAVGAIGIGGAVWATVAGKPGLGSCFGAAPGVLCLAAFIYLYKTEGP